MGVIYKITSPTGRIYIGQTKNLKKRVSCYRHAYNKNKFSNGHNKLYNSLKKYGFDNHFFEIIDEVEDELLLEREKYWIRELDTYCFENPKHLNMSRGGEGGGKTWMFDIERRKRQSERFKGAGASFYGKKHTEDNKKIIASKTSERNIRLGITVPRWGAEKGRLSVIKPVLLYDKNGEFIREFESYTLAGKSIGVKAGRVWESTSGRKSHCNGYHFRDKTDNYLLKIDISNTKLQNIKRPVLTLDINYEVVCEHPSAKEASDFWGIPKTTINRAAMYNWLVPIRSGHIFIYTDLYAEIEKLTA